MVTPLSLCPELVGSGVEVGDVFSLHFGIVDVVIAEEPVILDSFNSGFSNFVSGGVCFFSGNGDGDVRDSGSETDFRLQ